MIINGIEVNGEEIAWDIGLRLRETREQRGISIEEMAGYLDLTSKEYISTEEGTLQLDCGHYLILKTVLGITIDWLIGGDTNDMGKLIPMMRRIDNIPPQKIRKDT
jgi:transcriptional regulator with XRE-family HTH domain